MVEEGPGLDSPCSLDLGNSEFTGEERESPSLESLLTDNKVCLAGAGFFSNGMILVFSSGIILGFSDNEEALDGGGDAGWSLEGGEAGVEAGGEAGVAAGGGDAGGEAGVLDAGGEGDRGGDLGVVVAESDWSGDLGDTREEPLLLREGESVLSRLFRCTSLLSALPLLLSQLGERWLSSPSVSASLVFSCSHASLERWSNRLGRCWSKREAS